MKLTDLIHKKRRRGAANANPANSAKGEISVSKVSSFSVSKAQDSKNVHCQNDALPMPGFPLADGPFMPYVVPMSSETVDGMVIKLRATILELADLEKWSNDERLRVLKAVSCHSLSTLTDDLADMNERLCAAQAKKCAAELIFGARAKASRSSAEASDDKGTGSTQHVGAH